MTFSQKLLRDLILETRDGDWGQDVPKEGFVPYRVIRGGDFATVELGNFEKVPRCYLKTSTVQRRTLKAGDLLIETAGGTRDCPTGRVLYIGQEILDKFELPVTCASFARFIRLDEKKINPKFVFWHLRDMHQRGEMWQHQVQHTGVARFQWTKFADSHLIDLPPRDEQDRIVEILDSLSAKVVLNRQINQTLEQIAQAIFKSWFVYFEPVKAKIEAKAAGRDPERAAMCAISGKLEPELDQVPPEQYQQLAATAALFPNELVESELGSIPDGWRRVLFGDVIEILDSKRVPLSKSQREEKKGPYPYYGAASLMDYVDDYLFDGTYVLMAEDGSVMDNDGYPTTQYVWGKFWVNNHAHVLKGIDGVSDENILLFLKNTIIAPYITGAVQLKINQKNMVSIPFLKASKEIHTAFSKIIKPLFDGLKVSSEEIIPLSETRDILLPKLLSGDIETAV